MTTKLPVPKTWKSGTADEAWKVMICARDAAASDETLQRMLYILTDCGNNQDAGLETLRQMTGEQIVSGILAYGRSCHASIAAALGNKAA